MISLQTIIDTAWQEFVVEDKPPAVSQQDDYYGCEYLTDAGRRCAVGLCIPSGHELFEDQEKSFGDVVEHFPDLFVDDLESDVGRLKLDKFQSLLHDNMIVRETGEWGQSNEERAARYLEVAKEYRLLPPDRAENKVV